MMSMKDILFGLQKKLEKLWSGTKGEYDQTRAAAKVLSNVMRGGTPTKEELVFLKRQSVDLLKILGLIGTSVIPASSIILVAIERALKPYGISLLPKKQDIPNTLKEYRIFLDDERDVNDVYKDVSDFITVRDLEQLKSVILKNGIPSFISFDHDLGEDERGNILHSGYDAAKWMVNDMELDIRDMEFKVHSWNIQTRDQITGLLNNWKKELERRHIREEVRSIMSESFNVNQKRVPFQIDVPLDILAINDVFTANGHELLLVGGCVRDAVMGKKPKDFDLVTDAEPDRVEEILHAYGYKTLPVGKAFGVINVITDDDQYEIATYRLDIGSSDGRRPDSVEFTSMEEDAKRRDLTMNALYYDIGKKEIIDVVGGLDDIKNGIVRTVGNANDRFKEDRLRILRAIRFAARLGHEVDPEIDASLKADNSMDGVSSERIRDEFLKGISTARSVVQFLNMLFRYGLMDKILPHATHINAPIEERDTAILLAYLLMNEGSDKAMYTLKSGKYTNDEMKQVKFLLEFKHLSIQLAVKLKKLESTSNIKIEQIERFAKHIDMRMDMVFAFNGFKLTVSAKDFPETMPGPKLGELIYQKETENFASLI